MPLVKKKLAITTNSHILGYLCRELDKKPSFVQRLFDRKKVYLNGKLLQDKTYRGRGVLDVVVFEANTTGVQLNPIFLTRDFAIFDKPPFLLSHPKDRCPKETLLDSIRAKLGEDSGLCHRLDFETSGVIMAYRGGKNETPLKMLFEKREIKKSYIALVFGTVSKNMDIDVPLEANSDFRLSKHRSYVHKDGKKARTSLTILKHLNNKTLLLLTPQSGRMHQLRVHLAHIGHPIVGDPIYGRSFKQASDFLDGKFSSKEREDIFGASRVMLHAKSLEFTYKNIRYFIESPKDISKQIYL